MSIYHRIVGSSPSQVQYLFSSQAPLYHTVPSKLSFSAPIPKSSSKENMKSEVSFGNIENKNEMLIKLTPEEEERRSDELQKALLETIPSLIRGIELLGNDVDSICSAENLVEKRQTCQVLIDISKILREYPRGMGYRSKSIPPNLSGKPKLIAFRCNMDQLVWENISKLSILKDFVEFTLEFHKLYVIAISIRDAKNSFINNKCDHHLVKTTANGSSMINGILNSSPSLSSSTNSIPSSATAASFVDSSESSSSSDENVENNIISINISTVIHNSAKEEVNNTLAATSTKKHKHQPSVLSRAPKQVMESTRLLVDNVVNRKCMYREEKATMYREMMNDRLTLLKEDPKKYKQQLLQQRRSKLTTSDQNLQDELDEFSGHSSNHNNSNHSSASNIKGGIRISYDHGSVQSNPHGSPQISSGSPSSDRELSPNLHSNNPFLSTSPPKSPPKSPEFLGIPKNKKTHLSNIQHARSFTDHNSPPISPRSSEKIHKYYKLLSSSPSSSSSSVTSSPSSPTPVSLGPGCTYFGTEDDLWEDANDKSDFIAPKKGFKIDMGTSVVKSIQEDLQVLFMEDDEYHYHDDFSQTEHFNFLGYNKHQPGNPMAISVAMQYETNELIYIIRTSEKDERVRLSLNGKKDLSSKDMIKMIKKSRFNQLSNYKFKEIKEQSLVKQLTNFESKNIHKNFKFGVLYCKDDQGADENDMYSNNADQTSEAFQEFLKVLGEKVPLQGWLKYRGGLDIKENTTGTHSVYRKWRDYEIMYHVAPMIPCRATDEQSVERKRHLGNDIVLIIFKEGNSTLFDPSVIKSNFNHIFAVISVDNDVNNNGGVVDDSSNNSNETHYRISVGCKDEVGIFGPSFPRSQPFAASNFSDFLLAKLINGERAALRSPVFSQKIKRTRKEFLQSFIDEYINE
ncbi:hypothetical protein CYY_002288 [Polysphondylium violaceum]|uniref:GTPase-activating Rap/Ran-GAP domain-like protein 3 n=1 Tax=Polysphondylium violaceum TaxID=133409 RepID=A0A8J4PX08_9MYCE|nr:hypothetical protein CYY_002288 [Polysphondylium violaceum]